MSSYHEPVMGDEVLELLAPRTGGFYLDGTVGGGGHARLILDACGTCRVLGVDRDPEALEAARMALADVRRRVRLVEARFDRVTDDAEVRDRGLDGALLDLGVSSHQLDHDERGFAFRRGISLDMRMSSGDEGDARAFLAQADEAELTRVFRDYGEEPKARRLAREIVKRRSSARLETSDDLVAALTVATGRPPAMKEKARIFQAVRIAVNEELDALEAGLPAIRDVLKAGAVFVVIAYHSLEDRAVKNAFREWSRSCVCPPELPACVCRGCALGETLTRKVLRPQHDEIERNPRSRSARLRAWRRAA
jgi:16S rRNA (cytosine1402-N4)-methyltransferase